MSQCHDVGQNKGNKQQALVSSALGVFLEMLSSKDLKGFVIFLLMEGLVFHWMGICNQVDNLCKD